MEEGHPLRILFFIESGGPGGAERVVLSLAKGFHARGHAVTVLTIRTGWFTEELAKAGIEHIHLPSTKPRDIALPFRLARILRERQIDILHSHLLDSNFYGALAARLAGIPHLATEHGDVHHIYKKQFFAFKLSLPRMLGTTFTAVSKYTQAYLVSLGFAEARIRCIYNPVSLPNPVDPAERTRIRTELGVDENTWLWLHVANLRPVKDQQTLLRGFEQALRQTDRPQQLFLVGKGAEREALERLVVGLGLKRTVRFLGFRHDVPHLLAAADGFALTSQSEAMPMSLLEAASFGLYLVGTNVGGIPEIIKHERTGFLVEPHSPIELAQAFLFPFTNAKKAQQLGLAAREHVSLHFARDEILSQYEEAYRELLTRLRGFAVTKPLRRG